jgi:hypothetical protein
MPFEIQIAVAKTNKYASRESGDTVELVERPSGGLSVVLVDGQGSGQGAKTLSLLVSSKAVAMLKEGARDGAVARVVHDHLHTFRHGRVSATLEILSVDLVSKTVVSTRNSHTPLLIWYGGEYELRASDSTAIGIRRHTKPAIDQFSAEPGLRVILNEALAADQGRANDDMTVVALALGPRREYPHIRRMAVVLPLP